MAPLASQHEAPPRYEAPGYPDWQSALADAVRDAAELCQLLGLDPACAEAAQSAGNTHFPPTGGRAGAGFPLLVPRTFLARIRPRDPQDPLLMQVLPRAAELADDPRFRPDPLAEAHTTVVPGLLRKYPGRSLMVATRACAVHCRFCFRRHFRYDAVPARLADWEPALRQIAADRSIREVILSGGDPLVLEDSQLAQITNRLAEIPHLTRIRVHTRLPVMIPQRVTAELTGWLRGTRLSPIMVVQVNHPAEIDDAVADGFGRLVDAGVPLLNQAVLLRHVNDSVDVLAALCQRLVDLRVVPYYLHQLDPVAGASHFEVPIAAGRELLARLRARLPGYAVPRYVRETPGRASKELLS